MANRPRGQGQGKRSTSATAIAITERRAEALKRRKAGQTYEEFWAELGYSSRAAAVIDVKRALDKMLREPADELRELEAMRLDAMLVELAEHEAVVLEVRDRKHITVSHGRIITVPKEDGTEEPLLDDAPVLQANAQLMAIKGKRLEIQARRARLLGLDAPTQIDQTINDGTADQAFQEMVAEQRARRAEARELAQQQEQDLDDATQPDPT